MNREESLERARTAVQQILPICTRRGRILVLMQDNPDPDALASAMAFRELVRHHLNRPVAIGYGGICGRAENRAMLHVLRVRAVRLTPAQLRSFRTICLVDTQPGFGNNILIRDRMPDIVIDHHVLSKRHRWTAAFADVRPEYGATATIFYEYLTASGVRIATNLATGLFYGIQSDTQDLGREGSPADARAYQELFLKADKRKLGRIRRAPVPAAYFKTLSESLANCVLAGRTVIGYVPDCRNADMVAEIADMLLRLDGVRAAVCYGVCGDKIHLSARAVDARGNMAGRMKRAVARLGVGGGHRAMAGGQIPMEGDPVKRLQLVYDRILKAFAQNRPVRPLADIAKPPAACIGAPEDKPVQSESTPGE